ncbi:MAG: methyltransferase domain-containing protein [Limisphaerales bacterium]
MNRENCRIVEPELLDSLPPNDPAAVRSRADLRRVNWWMRNEWHVARAIESLPKFPESILEIGAGDGSFMLRVARRLGKSGRRRGRLYLLDMEPVVEQRTISELAELGWEGVVIRRDLREWLKDPEPKQVDLIAANLFLHHFEDAELRDFFGSFATISSAFVGCEPRRWRPSLIGTRLLWCIGCNHVTRHDAVVSVRAGFRERELSGLWPRDAGFELREEPAGFASHLFVATRRPG